MRIGEARERGRERQKDNDINSMGVQHHPLTPLGPPHLGPRTKNFSSFDIFGAGYVSPLAERSGKSMF